VSAYNPNEASSCRSKEATTCCPCETITSSQFGSSSSRPLHPVNETLYREGHTLLCCTFKPDPEAFFCLLFPWSWSPYTLLCCVNPRSSNIFLVLARCIVGQTQFCRTVHLAHLHFQFFFFFFLFFFGLSLLHPASFIAMGTLDMWSSLGYSP
jgi:hypothetical protein